MSPASRKLSQNRNVADISLPFCLKRSIVSVTKGDIFISISLHSAIQASDDFNLKAFSRFRINCIVASSNQGNDLFIANIYTDDRNSWVRASYTRRIPRSPLEYCLLGNMELTVASA